MEWERANDMLADLRKSGDRYQGALAMVERIPHNESAQRVYAHAKAELRQRLAAMLGALDE